MARVLIVDDDLDIRDAVSEFLSFEGHEVFTASDGEQALVRCRQLRPDLVLLDLMMPGMNGWDFRRAQLRDPAIAAIPVLVVSALGRVADLAVAGFLPKPFSLDDLTSAVRRLAGSAGLAAVHL
ncbi:MAG: response regulator [Anaeromyxobacter sp.]|nr:response regulator [Anaeromyxobacter sp.]MBL0275185.1 response regulator [Anaeromyxobacter sp.]